MLTQTRTVAKKVVDKKVGVMLASLESHSSTWLFQTNGVCEPKYAYPHKKGEGKKMTKKNLLLVSLFLVFGLVTMATTALAQVQWVAGAGESLSGRNEGLSEETGVVTLTTWTTGTVASGNYWTITYNAPVVPGSLYLECSGSAAPTSPFYSLEPGCGSILQATLDPTDKIVTIKFINGGANTVFPTGSSNSIALTVRIDATKAPCGQAVTALHTPYPLSGSLYGISDTTTGVYYPVLFVNCEPTLSLNFAAKDRQLDGATGAAAQVLNCIGAKEVGPYDKTFCINVDEEFAHALTSASYEMLSDPVDATNGTDFTITLTKVPTGLHIVAPVVTPCGSLDPKDPNYLTCIPTGSSYVPTLAVSAGAVACLPDAVVTGQPPTQTCTVTFTVVTDDAGNPENMDICFKFWSKGPLPTGYDEIYADVAKGPVNTATTTYIPSFSGIMELPLPGLSVVDFSACQTVLLYPYLVDDFGFGSGIAVANTTTDPFAGDPAYGKGSAVPQNGPCTFYLYATTPTATFPSAPLTATFTTPTIGTGQTYAFDMASKLMPNVAGYVIGVCEFQNAHGYALITYDFLGNNGVAANYLADVLPDPAFYRRSPAGDLLGETAIAPYMINRYIEKLLIYDPPKK
jgi:hypothetical protein